MTSSASVCVGITVPAAVSYSARNVAGHKLTDLPGGLSVMGSSRWDDATPRWVYLDPYSIGQTAVSEAQYSSGSDRPVTMVSY